jgi:hypothetical protein
MKKKSLQVSIHAREPSVVEVTVGDRVQLDRLAPSRHGYVAERLGRLLDPGLNTVALPPGDYCFKTLSDAHLRVVTGGVTTGIATGTKGSLPDPPPLRGEPSLPGAQRGGSLPAPDGAGDELPGELPSFTLEHA